MSEMTEKYYEGQTVSGIVTGANGNAIYLLIEEGVKGVIYADDLLNKPNDGKLLKAYPEGTDFTAQVKSIGKDKNKHDVILLTLSEKLQLEAEARAKKAEAILAKMQTMKEIKENDEIIKAVVKKVVSNGVELSYNNVRLFLPLKNASMNEEAFKKMINETIDVIVVYVNEEKHSVAVSQVAAEKKMKRLAKEAAFGALEVGQVVEGEVVSILDFGAILSFNNVTGLLHASELSHIGMRDVKKVLSVGQKLNVKIIKIHEGKVSLSVKALSKHPWEILKEQYHVGDVIEGKVKKIIPAGLIVELTPEYSGLMPKVEYSWFVNQKYEGVVNEGDTLTLKVMKIDDEQHRVSLSHRETLENSWSDVKLRKGQQITVTIVEAVERGATVKYKNVNGFLPVSETSSTKRVTSVTDLYPVGTEVVVSVSDFDASRAKFVVSIRQAEQAKERETFDNYMKEQAKEQEGSTTTLADLLKNVDVEEDDK